MTRASAIRRSPCRSFATVVATARIGPSRVTNVSDSVARDDRIFLAALAIRSV